MKRWFPSSVVLIALSIFIPLKLQNVSGEDTLLKSPPRLAPESSPYQPDLKPPSRTPSDLDTLRNWDLQNQSQSGQLTFISTVGDGGWRGTQIAAGDVNGDAHLDVVIGAGYVDALGRNNCGAVYVFYGPLTLQGSLNFDAANVKLYGPYSDAELWGLAVGDMNGDGLDDITMGVKQANEVFLVLGRSDLPAQIDIASRYDARFIGVSGEITGSTISLGDVNADDMMDILIAAPYGDGPGGSRPDCGTYYIVLGRTTWALENQLTDEIVIFGAEAYDGVAAGSMHYPGMQIVSGDINGDGFDDVLIGAPGGDGLNNAHSECGEAYALFGRAVWADTLDLATQADLVCYGIDDDDHIVRLGSGDVNGDGIDDFIIGARDADGMFNALPDAGEVYVVYGRSSFPATMAMDSLADVTIYGIDQGDVLGRMVAEDVNGDGVSDLLLGAPASDGPDNWRGDCGDAYILYGYNLPAEILMSNYPVHQIFGSDGGDALTAYGALAFGDLDEDGVVDLLIGACNGDGENNWYGDTGEAYIVSGWHLTGNTYDVAVIELLAPLGEVSPDTTITPRAVVKNLGLYTETFPVTMRIGGDYFQALQVTLAQNEIDTLSFPDWTAAIGGTHAVACSTGLPTDQNHTNDMKTGTVIVPETGPMITSIFPDHGGNAGFITAEIHGLRFLLGATAKLTKTGEADIIADTSTTVFIDSTLILATFNLTDQALGAWNVIVQNPDGESGSFYNGFTIETGDEDALSVHVWTQSNTSPGETINYIIEYENTGSNDASDVVIYSCLDSLVNFVSASQGAYYNSVFHCVAWDLGVLPANSNGFLTIQVSTPWGLSQGVSFENFTHIFNADTTGYAAKSYSMKNNNYNNYMRYQNLFLNGIGLKFNDPDPTGGAKKYPQFANAANAAWIPLYYSGNFLWDAVHVDNATPNPYVLPTDYNGLTQPLITNHTYDDVIAYSGGTRTALTAIRLNQLRCNRLILISPMSGLQAPGAYRDELEAILDSGWVNEIIIYESEKDWLLFDNLYQGYFSPTDPWVIEHGIIINPSSLSINGRQLNIDQAEINKKGHWGLFQYLNSKLEGNPASASSASCQINVAIDPNEKIGPEGVVIPGQLMQYRIYYENVGLGIAYGVYFTDQLDERLDETTLTIGAVKDMFDSTVIASPGIYNSATRTITWAVGEVGPGEGGFADLSVYLNSNLPDSAEIINFAIVHFPSVPEVTYTNGVVSWVVLPATPAEHLSDVTVYPNPFKPNSNLGHTGITFGHPSDLTRRLTIPAIIKIYTITGELVRTLSEPDLDGNPDGVVVWDGKNEDGNNVVSGVYLYRISNPAGEEKLGKVAIIR